MHRSGKCDGRAFAKIQVVGDSLNRRRLNGNDAQPGWRSRHPIADGQGRGERRQFGGHRFWDDDLVVKAMEQASVIEQDVILGRAAVRDNDLWLGSSPRSSCALSLTSGPASL